MKKLFLILLLICCNISYVYGETMEDAKAIAIVLQGTPEDVLKLAKSGYDLNRVYNCQTPLTAAISSAAENLAVSDSPKDALKKIRILLDNGSDYNQEPCPGKSLRPIFWAVTLPLILKQTEIELNEGLDENIRNGTDYCEIPNVISKPCNEITPEEREKARQYFHESTVKSIKALSPYFTEIVKLLLRRGVDLRKKDTKNQSVLHYAASVPEEMSDEPLKLLLKRRISVDLRNTDTFTPLFFAYGAHNKKSVELLLDAGADPTMVDKEGYLPKQSKTVKFNRTERTDRSISIKLEN